MNSEFGLHNRRTTRDAPATADHLAPELDLWRESMAGLDWMTLRLSAVFRDGATSMGDGAGVVLIAGLLATDRSMHELEGWLSRSGYRPYRSGVGRNACCPELSLAAIVRTLDRAFDETGRRVHIVGHSLGGLLGRGAAVVRPRQVEQVITLGTPVNGARVHPLVAMAAEAVRGECDGECLAALQRRLPADIPETNVYSRGDGVVDWRTCMREDASCIEVTGTHIGLIVNRQVYEVLDALLAPDALSRPTLARKASRQSADSKPRLALAA